MRGDYDEIGRVYKKRESFWSKIITIVFGLAFWVFVIGGLIGAASS